MEDQNKNIAIVGAGLVGALLASILAQKGHSVNVYERRPDMRKTSISAGRSINLALSDRGWKALELAGVADKVRAEGIPMYGRMIHNEDGSTAFQPYGKEDQAIYSVSRGGLNMTLMSHAEENGAQLFFEKRCHHVDLQEKKIYFDDETVNADIIFGADGAFSMVRHSMQLTDRFNYSQNYLEHGYKELSIPPAENGGFLIEKNALHIWPRKSFMLIALPNIDGSFTCTLFAPFEGENSFESVKNTQDLRNFFQLNFADAIPLMPTLEKDFFENPTSSLVTIRCFPWVNNDSVALIGDAAHGIVPFYGQGMNAGFEDCTVLNQIIEKNNGNWSDILSQFQNSRKPNTDAIAELALRNFIEMRDLVADPEFLIRKQIEKKLNQHIPDQFLPLYAMVTFSHIPYSVALKEGRKQDRYFEMLKREHLLEKNIKELDLNKLTDLWLKLH